MSKLFVNTIAPNSGDTVTLSGSLVTTGKLTIGDATSDTVVLTAEISSSIIPDATATYDLGTMSKAWRNLHAHGLGHIHTASINVVSSSLIPDAGGIHALGTMAQSWGSAHIHGLAHIHTASIGEISSSLIPYFPNRVNLGGSGQAWKDLHLTGVAYAGNIQSHSIDITALNGDLTLTSSQDIILAANGGNIEFFDQGTKQLSLDMDSTVGAQIIQTEVDGDDLVFKQYDGAEVLRLSDDGSGSFTSDLTVGDDLSLISDSAVFNMGLGNDFTITHDGTTGATLAGNPININYSAGVISGSGTISAGTVNAITSATASAALVSADLRVGDDLSLTSDSAVFNMGLGNDFTITHDGTTGATLAGNPININYSAGTISGSGTISAGTVNAITSATASILKVGEVNIDTTTAASTDLASTAFFNVNGSKVTVQAITAANIADGAFTKFELRNTSIATDSVIYGAFTGLHAQSSISSSLISVATIAAKTASVFIHNETGVQINADTPFTASFVIL